MLFDSTILAVFDFPVDYAVALTISVSARLSAMRCGKLIYGNYFQREAEQIKSTYSDGEIVRINDSTVIILGSR